MNSNQAHKTLQVEGNAKFEEVKYAYRKLALQYHPDKNRDSKSEKRFKIPVHRIFGKDKTEASRTRRIALTKTVIQDLVLLLQYSLILKGRSGHSRSFFFFITSYIKTNFRP